MDSYSKHLSDQEKRNLYNQFGSREECLSAAIVQLLFATNTRPSRWEVKITGVACFVKDSNRRGFYIEVREKLGHSTGKIRPIITLFLWVAWNSKIDAKYLLSRYIGF